MSFETMTGDLTLTVRGGGVPAKFFTAGRGITGPEPGRTTAPYWVTTIAEARNASTEYLSERLSAWPPVSPRTLGSWVTSWEGGAGTFSEAPSPCKRVWRFARAVDRVG